MLRVDRVPILIVSLSVKCLRELFAVLFECFRFVLVKNERVLVLRPLDTALAVGAGFNTTLPDGLINVLIEQHEKGNRVKELCVPHPVA